MKYLSMIGLVILLVLPFGDSYGEGQPHFALTFDCGMGSHELCLIGQMALGKSITLLSRENSEICRARTADPFMYFFEAAEKEVASTHLRLGKCRNPWKYFLAYLGTGQVKYQLLDLTLFEEKDNARNFDRIVRKQKLLEDEAFVQTYPKVFRLPVSRKNIFIGQYEAEGQAGYGPLFLSVPRKVEKIHFLASAYRVFRLNGRLYLMFHWRGALEDSGDQGSALVELTASGFKLILEDASWSK